MELPTCTKGVTCTGHRAHDILPMGDFLGHGETYSNVEWYNFTRPWNEDLPYVGAHRPPPSKLPTSET